MGAFHTSYESSFTQNDPYECRLLQSQMLSGTDNKMGFKKKKSIKNIKNNIATQLQARQKVNAARNHRVRK